jgi:DASH complex subunit DAD3
MTSPEPIFETNPYETHPSLSPLEADVLWEYAKLSQHVKEVRTISFRPKPRVEEDVRVDDCSDA